MGKMHPRYAKTEIFNRIRWVNNFRIVFGSIFFIGLILMNVSRVILPEPTFVLVLVGLFILFYAILTYYYLETQKPTLNELILLSVFLGVVDLIFITAFVYFSGGFESPYFVFYLLVLTAVLVSAPYFPKAVFLGAAATAVFYDSILFLTAYGMIPYYSRRGEVFSLLDIQVRQSMVNSILVPAVIFFFSLGVFMVEKFLEKERQDLKAKIESDRSFETKVTALSSVYWTLTHVLRPEPMLSQALSKTLEALGLSSGMICLVDPRKGLTCRTKQGVSQEIVYNFEGKKIVEVAESLPNLKGIIVGNEVIHNISIRKLFFRNKALGLLVLFGKEGEEWLDPKLNVCLDALADEIAAAIYYGKIFKTLKTA